MSMVERFLENYKENKKLIDPKKKNLLTAMKGENISFFFFHSAMAIG